MSRWLAYVNSPNASPVCGPINKTHSCLLTVESRWPEEAVYEVVRRMAVQDKPECLIIRVGGEVRHEGKFWVIGPHYFLPVVIGDPTKGVSALLA